MALTLKHQTKLQFCKRLRERYRAAEKIEACRLSYILLSLLDSGEVTQANVLNAWNMTQAEWDAKRTAVFQPRANKWLAYKAAMDATNTERGD
jgi:hypothetical protein